MAIVKAMIETGIYADFIVVDGGEGGTGAAPLEFSDSLGAPLNEGLMLVQNTLVGAGIRDKFKIGASGKMVTASAMARSMAMGADWCNSARAFMFAVGLHPVAALPHQPLPGRRHDAGPQAAARADRAGQGRARAQLPPQHGPRSGRDDRRDGSGPHHELGPQHVVRRVTQFQALALYEIYEFLSPNAFLDGTAPPRFQGFWDQASAESFRPWSASEKAAAAAS